MLDEADRMMDMGFWPDVRRIVQTLPDSAARQTLLFSATMPDEVMRLADEVVREPKYVQIGSAGGPAKTITHTVENVPSGQKTEWLAKFLRRADGPVLVFVRTKSGAERLARKLAAFGLKAAALHADRTQAQRTQAVEGFRSGRYRVLVATDVAARGLDIDGITHVVNYEVPSNRETYVHRVGRTGRAEATGHRTYARRTGRIAGAASAPAFIRNRAAGINGRNDQSIRAGRRVSGRTARAGAFDAGPGHRLTSGRTLQVVPLALLAGRWCVLHAPGRSAVCGQGRVCRRLVVPGLRFLQAAPHTQEARTSRFHVLTVNGEGRVSGSSYSRPFANSRLL